MMLDRGLKATAAVDAPPDAPLGAEAPFGPRLHAAPGSPDVAAGQTQSLSGILRSTIELGAGAVLTRPDGGSLAIFGAISGPQAGTATLAVAAGATLYAAGAIGPSVEASFAGPAGTLELAALYLPEMAGSITGFAVGEVIDIISGTADSVALADFGGQALLTLFSEGQTIGTLRLADAIAGIGTAFAVPDAIDGTRLLMGYAMPVISGTVPGGTAYGGQFVWGGGPAGQWADATAWRNAAGGNIGTAPGGLDHVMLAGPTGSVLSVAGNGAAASLSTQGLVALGGSITAGTLVTGAGTLDALLLTAGCQVAAGTVSLHAGVLQVVAAGAMLEVTGAVTLQSGYLWAAEGGQVNAQTLVLAGGSVRIGTAGMVSVGGAGVGGGTLAIAAGGLITGFGTIHAPVLNQGTLLASGGGILAIYGELAGGGLAQIERGSTLYAPDGIAAGQQIAFSPAGGGTLELFGSAAACAATITGFGVGDEVDIASDTLSQAVWTTDGSGLGELDLGQAGTLEIGLAPGMDLARASFSIASDGIGGTRIAMVPCFCEGTRLAAPRGEIAVETIRPGDRLLTRSGAARRVRWVGRRAYDPATLRTQAQLRPVRINAHALGRDQPRRDLRLSPQHAVALATPSGLRLVPAVALVDGVRIWREMPDAPVCYLHIELDSHDLLLAEGLAAESFLGAGPERRSLFQNGVGSPAPDTGPCCPRLEEGGLLADLRQRLHLGPGSGLSAPLLRGNLDGAWRGPDGIHVEGWAMRAADVAGTVWLEIALDGALYGHIPANRWRPDLDNAGMASGCCAFRLVLPSGSIGRSRQLSVRAARPSPGPAGSV